MTYIFLSLIVGIYLLFISLERERERERERGRERGRGRREMLNPRQMIS
jgi:hypothetical protein